jgi:hypothetical protein
MLSLIADRYCVAALKLQRALLGNCPDSFFFVIKTVSIEASFTTTSHFLLKDFTFNRF